MAKRHGFRSGARRATLPLALALVTAAAPLPVRGMLPRLARFLRKSIGLESGQIREVSGGSAVVKVLETPIKRDVAVFGVIRVNVPREFYVDRTLRAAEWLAAPNRPRFGVFGTPARERDVRDVSIDRDDVRELENCRSGHCGVKLPAAEMRRIRQDIDWSASDPGPQVDAYARTLMVAYVNAYRARGDSAMVEYDDHGNVRSSDAFAALLAESPYVYEYVAPFHRYLADYPRVPLPGVKDLIYWAEDALPGLRPILSITHLSVYAPPDHPGTTVVARKQIYADHYFEAVFDLTLVVDRPDPHGEPGIYLVVIRRYRFDNLPGGIFNIRGKVIGKLREKLRGDLRRERQACERAFGSPVSPASGSTPSRPSR